MEQYLEERSMLFNVWSTFSCPDSCERMGCKEPSLHVSISLVDLVAISLISGQKAAEVFKEQVKIGFDPIYENEPWIGRISLELKKPCHFLDEKKCSIYSRRPIACVLFPEYYSIVEHPELILQKEIFQNYPCIQKPCSIPLQRKAVLQQLWKMSLKEIFLSDFYLFGVSPFIIDLKSIAGEGMEGIPISENGKTRLPHYRMEKFISQRLREGGYVDDWEAKIEKLDSVDGLEGLKRMKPWADQMAMVSDRFCLNIIYQFDGNQLLPIRSYK
jgi:Fe-S-cluster containining protein